MGLACVHTVHTFSCDVDDLVSTRPVTLKGSATSPAVSGALGIVFVERRRIKRNDICNLRVLRGYCLVRDDDARE